MSIVWYQERDSKTHLESWQHTVSCEIFWQPCTLHLLVLSNEHHHVHAHQQSCNLLDALVDLCVF